MLENPPHAFNVIVGKGDVGIVKIDPECGAFGQLFPLVDVLEDIGSTLGVELGNAIFFNLTLVFETEFLLDLNLNRQSVCIPAAAAQAIVPLHDLVAREHIFESARQHMVAARLAICRRGTLIKDISGRILATLGRPFEDSIETPKVELLLLELIDDFTVDLRVYGSKHEYSLLHATDANGLMR